MLQHVKRQEAERQRISDEESLRKQMNAKRAKEQAEKLHMVRTMYTDKICTRGRLMHVQMLAQPCLI